MNFKSRAIAALEELKGDTTGIIAATIEDRQRVIGDIPEDAGWIPVTERLPENDSNKPYAERIMHNIVVNDFVSAAVYGSKVGESVYDWWVDRRGYVVEGVTHWHPAPLPPKEDS